MKDGQFGEKNNRNEGANMQAVFQVFKYVSNTTNMWFHLQTHHHEFEYAAIESQERARPASSGSSTSAGSSRTKPTLVESFKSETSLLHTSHHWKNLTVNHQLIAFVFALC